MWVIFCMDFQRVPLKFHTKCLTHTLNDAILCNVAVLRALWFLELESGFETTQIIMTLKFRIHHTGFWSLDTLKNFDFNLVRLLSRPDTLNRFESVRKHWPIRGVKNGTKQKYSEEPRSEPQLYTFALALDETLRCITDAAYLVPITLLFYRVPYESAGCCSC